MERYKKNLKSSRQNYNEDSDEEQPRSSTRTRELRNKTIIKTTKINVLDAHCRLADRQKQSNRNAVDSYNLHHPTSPISYRTIYDGRKASRQTAIEKTATALTSDSIKCLSFDGKRVDGKDKNAAIIRVENEDYLLGFGVAKGIGQNID